MFRRPLQQTGDPMAEAFLGLYRQTTRFATWSLCIAAFFFVLGAAAALLGFPQATSFGQVSGAFACVFAALFAFVCIGWLVSAVASWITARAKPATQKI
jgi:hypothetical protein